MNWDHENDDTIIKDYEYENNKWERTHSQCSLYQCSSSSLSCNPFHVVIVMGQWRRRWNDPHFLGVPLLMPLRPTYPIYRASLRLATILYVIPPLPIGWNATLLVPRVLMIDEPTNFYASPSTDVGRPVQVLEPAWAPNIPTRSRESMEVLQLASEVAHSRYSVDKNSTACSRHVDDGEEEEEVDEETKSRIQQREQRRFEEASRMLDQKLAMWLSSISRSYICITLSNKNFLLV